MKKIKYLLLIAIISFFVIPGSINASAPADLHIYVAWCGGMGCIQTNELSRGEKYSIMTYSSGGFLYENEYLSFVLDENIFKVSNFSSDYGFQYQSGKIKLEGNKLLEEGFSTKEPARLWIMEVEVKENAKLGKTKIDDVSFEIVCSEEEVNNGVSGCTKEELQKPNNSIQEENDNSNSINNVVLDDTKFYVLSGLLGAAVIEMFVLLIRKGKKA